MLFGVLMITFPYQRVKKQVIPCHVLRRYFL